MSTLIMGFSRPKKFKVFAELIMWWDGTDVSHGFSLFPSTAWGVEFIYQAAGRNMHFMTRTNFEKINIIKELVYLDVPSEVVAEIGKYCAEKDGTPYGVKQVIGNIYVNSIYWLSGKKIKLENPFADGEHTQTCIEVQVRMISNHIEKAFGKEHLPKFDIENVSVKEVHEWVKSLPNVVRVENLA